MSRITSIALVLLIGSNAGFARDYGDVDKVNGGISIEDNSTAGTLETVNGGISVGDNVRAHALETVNGGIKVGANTQVGLIETVNGGINVGRRSVVSGNVEAVNGGVRLHAGAKVHGRVENVNGGVTAIASTIGGGIGTVNGEIVLDQGTQVRGGIHVEKPRGWGNLIQFGDSKPPRVVIGRNSIVQGELRFDREVRLYVHQTARIGRVTGATATPYNTDEAPR
ncbi:MAG: hypothetical protein ABIP49_08915 [Lysobacterales bacterium]